MATNFRLRIVAALAACTALFGSPASAETVQVRPGLKSLALVSVTGGQGFPRAEMSTLEEILLTALADTRRFKVIGPTDIQAMVSLESRKEQVGCGDTECAVRIAGALGVDYVATANIGRVGNKRIVALKVIDVRSASVMARRQEIVTTDDDLPDAAARVAAAIVEQLWPSAVPPAGFEQQPPPPPPPFPPPPPPGSPRLQPPTASTQIPTLEPPQLVPQTWGHVYLTLSYWGGFTLIGYEWGNGNWAFRLGFIEISARWYAHPQRDSFYIQLGLPVGLGYQWRVNNLYVSVGIPYLVEVGL